ncbi:MAG: glycosyltransferase family 2 protein [Pseudomonadota bacterium]
MRWKRRRLWLRAARRARDLTRISPPPSIARGDILAFATLRDEAERLPHWLDHSRRIGVHRFLIVDNASSDGSTELLADEPDVTLWRTDASYREARFGMDWITALQNRYADGHWCVTADADEVLIYPHWEERPLATLAAELDARGQPALGALMVELFPKGPLTQTAYHPGTDPVAALPFFDATGYRAQRQRPARNLWVQGGPRDRLFFADTPRRAPTLNKLPFLRWRRGQAWLNATHAALPPRLNLAWNGPGDSRLSGALLHTKFLPSIVAKSALSTHRAEHFGTPALFASYHDALAGDPDLWHAGATRFVGWRQLEDLGLLSSGGW